MGYRNFNIFHSYTGGHGAQSLDDVGLHVFTFERVPMYLPQPFNSDVRNSVTGRVKVLGYWLAAVVADVGQMLGKANYKGPGGPTDVDRVA